MSDERKNQTQAKPQGGAMLAAQPAEALHKPRGENGENLIIASLREARLRETAPAPTILSQRNRK